MLFIIIVMAIIIAILWHDKLVDTFKISYYETRLENRGVDISNVKNITLKKIYEI